MSKIRFVNVNYVKDNTPMDLNIDVKLITPCIDKAQALHIQKDLGSILYKSLQTMIKNGTITDVVNVKYKLLLDDYIIPSLTEWVLFEILPFLNYKLTNKNIGKRNSDSSTPSDVTEIKWIRNSVRNSAEFYSQLTISFLKENKTDYSELSDNSNCDDIRPSKGGFFGGVYLGPKSKY